MQYSAGLTEDSSDLWDQMRERYIDRWAGCEPHIHNPVTRCHRAACCTHRSRTAAKKEVAGADDCRAGLPAKIYAIVCTPLTLPPFVHCMAMLCRDLQVQERQPCVVGLQQEPQAGAAEVQEPQQAKQQAQQAQPTLDQQQQHQQPATAEEMQQQQRGAGL